MCFIKKVSDVIPELNNDFAHGHFEYSYVFLAKKPTIIKIFQ